MKLRTYQEMVDAIIRAMPLQAEMHALTEEQNKALRQFGNTYDNLLYLNSAEGNAYVAKYRAKQVQA